jgi:AsmA-like C-terminal region
VNWKKGSLVEPLSSLAMNDVNMELIYGKRGAKDWVEVKSLNAALGGGQWNVTGRLDNLASPIIASHVKVEAQLADLKEYLKWDTLEIANGLVKLEADLGGDAAILSDSTIDWTQIQASGNVQIENAELKLKAADRVISGLSGQFRLFEQSAGVDQLKFNIGGNDFAITGQFDNLIPFWFKPSEILKAKINIESNSINADDLISAENSRAVHFAVPRLEWEGSCHIGQFKFKDFVSNNIQLQAGGNENSLKISQLDLQMANGNCTGSLALNRTEENNWQLISQSSLHNADIQSLFAMFHDFGQKVVKSEQIHGRVNAETDLKMTLESDFKVIRSSIDLVSDVSLTNGNIKNLEWLNEVADYIKKNRWIAPLVDEDLLASRLSNVEFTELKNIISLQEDVLEIPWMQINTSAFNMSMKAIHHLNVEMEYLFGIQVADLLMRDASQQPKADGKKIFILMKGPVDNVKFSVENEPEEVVFSGSQEEQKLKWLDRMRAKRKDKKMERMKSTDVQDPEATQSPSSKKRKRNRRKQP